MNQRYRWGADEPARVPPAPSHRRRVPVADRVNALAQRTLPFLLAGIGSGVIGTAALLSVEPFRGTAGAPVFSVAYLTTGLLVGMICGALRMSRVALIPLLLVPPLAILDPTFREFHPATALAANLLSAVFIAVVVAMFVGGDLDVVADAASARRRYRLLLGAIIGVGTLVPAVLLEPLKWQLDIHPTLETGVFYLNLPAPLAMAMALTKAAIGSALLARICAAALRSERWSTPCPLLVALAMGALWTVILFAPMADMWFAYVSPTQLDENPYLWIRGALLYIGGIYIAASRAANFQDRQGIAGAFVTLAAPVSFLALASVLLLIQRPVTDWFHRLLLAPSSAAHERRRS